MADDVKRQVLWNDKETDSEKEKRPTRCLLGVSLLQTEGDCQQNH